MFGAKSSPHPDEMAERLRELERQLLQKDTELQDRERTCQELTKRLAQTVEKLDRVQRVGTDRAIVSTAAFPKEVVEQQTELVGDLKRAVELWENMQMSCNLGRFEMQITDLKELFEEHFREEEPEEEAEAESETSEEKAGEVSAESEDEAEASAGDPEESADAGEEEDDEDVYQALDDFSPVRPPEILDLAEAGEEALRRCAEQQDDYIDYLSARLKRVAENTKAVDWEDLREKPEKLRTQLERTASKLQQSRHFAEIELALQRTRLKRRERELQAVSQDLERQMESLGHPQPENGKDPNGGRWMRMLGMRNKESE